MDLWDQRPEVDRRYTAAWNAGVSLDATRGMSGAVLPSEIEAWCRLHRVTDVEEVLAAVAAFEEFRRAQSSRRDRPGEPDGAGRAEGLREH